jgi:hypothetical protein
VLSGGHSLKYTVERLTGVAGDDGQIHPTQFRYWPQGAFVSAASHDLENGVLPLTAPVRPVSAHRTQIRFDFSDPGIQLEWLSRCWLDDVGGGGSFAVFSPESRSEGGRRQESDESVTDEVIRWP